MPTGTIDSTIPQTSNTVNNTPTYITDFKTAVLNIFGIGDNTSTTQAMTIASTGKVVFTVSPVTITGLATSAGAQSLVVTPGAHTAVIAEVQDVDIEAHTMTITGAITTQRFTFLGQPTITAASALTVTTAATFDIAGPPMPTGAGPCTITNAYGGRIEAGTLTASAATTVDTAASFVIEGAPIRGTNVTITNTYGGLFRESGAKTLASTAVRIANTATSTTGSIDKVGLSVTSTGDWSGASANNVGIDIAAITGGTNNYSLRCAQQIKSTVGAGTAPFVVDSGTLVTNLNADSLDGLDSGSLLRSDASDSYTSGTLTLDAATTLDINGNVSIADTSIAFDGATTNFACTGTLTIGIGGSEKLRIVSTSTAAAPTMTFDGDTNTGIYSSGADQISITVNGVETLRITAAGFYPVGAGLVTTGGAADYWNDISYKTLTDRGCLGSFDVGVEMPDGSIVDDVTALKSIRNHPTELTVYGVPRFDYRTMPKAVYKKAARSVMDRNGVTTLTELARDVNDRPYFEEGGLIKYAQDGAELTALISILIGAVKQLDARLTAARI